MDSVLRWPSAAGFMETSESASGRKRQCPCVEGNLIIAVVVPRQHRVALLQRSTVGGYAQVLPVREVGSIESEVFQVQVLSVPDVVAVSFEKLVSGDPIRGDIADGVDPGIARGLDRSHRRGVLSNAYRLVGTISSRWAGR